MTAPPSGGRVAAPAPEIPGWFHQILGPPPRRAAVPVYPAEERPAYASTEKVALEPDELEILTVAGFRAVLALVLARAGLTCGQVAAKTGIGRSSVYNLVDLKRTGLPTKADQVHRFLCACGLQLHQVAAVMHAWELLDAARPKPTGKPAPAAPAGPAPGGIRTALTTLNRHLRRAPRAHG